MSRAECPSRRGLRVRFGLFASTTTAGSFEDTTGSVRAAQKSLAGQSTFFLGFDAFTSVVDLFDLDIRMTRQKEEDDTGVFFFLGLDGGRG